MSIKALSTVWETSNQSGTNLLVLLAIADYAQDNGINAYPSYSRLGKKARLSRRGAIKAIARLKEAGEIIIHVEAGARTRNNRHTNSFDIIFQDGSNWGVIANRCQSLGTPLPPKPKRSYGRADGEPQGTNKKPNGELGDTINGELGDTINGEPQFTQNPSIEPSKETTTISGDDDFGQNSRHPDYKQLADFYQKQVLQAVSLSPVVASDLDDILSGKVAKLNNLPIPLDLVLDACREMVRANKQNIHYLIGILSNWQRNGGKGQNQKRDVNDLAQDPQYQFFTEWEKG